MRLGVLAQRRPAVALDAAGNFVVAWESVGQDGDGYGVYARRYSAAGVAQGAEFVVNAHTVGGQGDAAVAVDADGAMLVCTDGRRTQVRGDLERFTGHDGPHLLERSDRTVVSVAA